MKEYDAPKVSFLEMGHRDETGKIANEKFFEGRLPNIGEPVEYIYMGADEHGWMRFQLKVRET